MLNLKKLMLMKKILLVCLFVWGIVPLSIFSQTSRKIGISTTFTGIISAGGNYSSQKGDFFVGWTKGSYGRGYLQFDLSSVPAGSTINEVALHLTSKVDFSDNNFEGKINLYATTFMSDGNYTTWHLMNPIGEPVISAKIPGQGLTLGFTSAHLKALVSQYAGKKLYLFAVHPTSGKILRLSTSSENLYLYVHYSPKDPYGGGTGGGNKTYTEIINGPHEVFSGDTVIYTVSESLAIPYADSTYFERIETRERYAKYKVKAVPADINTKVTSYYSYYYPGTMKLTVYKGEKDITIRPAIPIIELQSDLMTCPDNISTYRIKNYNDMANRIINWDVGQNMTLVSGQGTSIATFKASGNGYGTVRVIHNSSIIENSDVWVGPPILQIRDPREPADNPVLGGYEPMFRPNTEYEIYDRNYAEGNTYTWSVDGNVSIVNQGYGSVRIKTGTIPINTKATFAVVGNATNRCGTPRFPAMRIFTLDNTDELYIPDDPNLLTKSTAPEVNPSEPVTVQIYSFTTGSLVYSQKNVMNFDIKNTTLKDDIYIVVTTDKNGESKSQKIMKTSR